MFIISGKKHGIVWDAEEHKPLIKFLDGKAETNDRKTAEKLKKLVFKVDGLISDNKPIEPKTSEGDNKPTQRKKKRRLSHYD